MNNALSKVFLSKNWLEKLKLVIKSHFSLRFINSIKYNLPSFVLRKKSYSQSGEDLIVVFLLDLICGNRPKSYVDIGANHPFHLSNTANLYKLGGRGVLVEPDPYFANLLRRKRPGDLVVEAGIHFSGAPEGDFYLIDTPTLNTFSLEEAKSYERNNHKILKRISVPLLNINEILSKIKSIDFLNLDIEGLDYEVVKQIDFSKNRPLCICVETLDYDTSYEPKKSKELIDYMIGKKYFLYADTYINSIFVDSTRWNKFWKARIN